MAKAAGDIERSQAPVEIAREMELEQIVEGH